MSTHPNAILMAVMQVNGTTRKTLREICEGFGVECDGDETLPIGPMEEGKFQRKLNVLVMEDDWDEGTQITAPEGSLVFWSFVTYGYGENIAWNNLQARRDELDAWMQALVAKHGGTYEIQLTANYW